MTLDPRQEMITKLIFLRLDKQYKSFQDLGPKYGIAYLRVLEISQNKPLKRKDMTA